MTDHARTRGRPRDPAIDDAALVATRELLAEVGWDRTTMVSIAERAGVGKPALYRRWPSKAQLVFEAVFDWTERNPQIPTDLDPDAWVRELCHNTLELFGRPEVRASLPGLLGAFQDHPELATALWTDFGAPGTGLFADKLARLGDEHAVIDAQITMLLVVGASMVLRMMPTGGGDTALTRRMADILIGGVTPR
ncbi:TetR/AcrR family transcriptional regulator [Rhodococcus sp. D2-41]|uniref:TetR/AcrR family transcriptional regulator n=1 Tax=Speluncibacter jeojiensis TaxID=2710754 RepID=A0A9X4LZI2_9ACTN|nr:TetR/AcrR family transcriptional regulator [Rhodococcus sp. D2-41]MDG3011559.1 TetR/AcrR family transcriptional regulator [Rhodococcus sp. D2-41]MDG3015084.1 TetR/AcrR family transcriptional regulator [Corynebacteriales bacterium D3-21]